MAVWTYSGNVYNSSPAGTTAFPLVSGAGYNIEYLQRSHIHAYTSEDEGVSWVELSSTSDFTLNTAGTEVVLTTGITAGQWVRVQRETPYSTEYVNFQPSSQLTAGQLNIAEEFSIYVDQEITDRLASTENLAFKYFGFIDVTADKAPANPTNGTFFINSSGAGNVRNSWTGIVGEPVVGAEQIVYDYWLKEWEILRTPTSQIGVNSIAGDAPITVDGSTASVPIIGIDVATTSSKGALSAADKTKLNSISPGATVNNIVGAGAITVDGSTPSAPIIGILSATTTAKGALSAADKTKLNSINAGAGVDIQQNPPSNPDEGQVWWDKNEGRPYIWYEDADSQQWVDFVPNNDLRYRYPGGKFQTLQNRLEQRVSVKDFGAVGDGVNDDSGAFRKAFAACQGVYVPAGEYFFDGPPITTIKQVDTPALSVPETAFHLYGDGATTSRIVMAPGRTFMDYSHIRQCHVHDLGFYNFLHCFKFTGTAENVANRKMWENCIFEGYTGCAISQQQEDSPYWSVQNCTFKADLASNTSIGVALGNNPNLSAIKDNHFIRNRVHLKLGGGGVDVLVEHNDFLQFPGNTVDPRVAIWIYTDSIKGDGAGLNVFSNKFGNEGKRADDKYIVYADQRSGTFNGDKFPELTQDAAGTKEFRQSQFINNKIQGGGGALATPFIFSTTRFLTDFVINENNFKSAIAVSYWVEFLNPSTSLSSYNHRWFFGVFGGDDVQQTGVAPEFSNEILNLEVFSADTGTEIWTQKHSPNPLLGVNRVGYYMVSNTEAGLFTVSGGASKTADIVDGTGGTNAAQFNVASGIVYPKAFTGSFPGGVNNDGEAGDPLWLHFDLKQSASDPMAVVSVAFRKAGNGARQWARFIPVPKNWTTFRFPVFIRDSSTTMLLEFKKGSGGGSIDIGRYCLYSSKDCVPQGPVTFDSVKSDTMTMASPDGTVYNVTVANGGTLTVTAA